MSSNVEFQTKVILDATWQPWPSSSMAMVRPNIHHFGGKRMACLGVAFCFTWLEWALSEVIARHRSTAEAPSQVPLKPPSKAWKTPSSLFREFKVPPPSERKPSLSYHAAWNPVSLIRISLPSWAETTPNRQVKGSSPCPSIKTFGAQMVLRRIFQAKGKRQRGGIEPLHVPMPHGLKPCPGTSLTHPG